MSDCNIGARKNKDIKNHLFIVYAALEGTDAQIVNSAHCVPIFK